ncbi:lipopolysaccharide biosynthesis protein [Chitinophaga nivalis]|uniref:Oligosaccharide flippase family protein n=1 Tax=Chitinophaga nivalis TaxID=2991709 RepID=A0ABT3IME4_9BACT|nr:oligosaccharide flippase family protein [Chitinophaga nivalis]MCW3465409.1 oligosaccharide flippase family protein [Chitinophaga nivalis]MCW3484899.1 oligosaccharide flippase family protein [Chitinophaga nivalis]
MSDQKYTYWLKSGIFSGMQKVAVLLFGIGSVLILTRTLSKPDMGVWNLFLAYTGLIEIVRQSLIKNAVIKYINSTQPTLHAAIQGAALTMNIMITVVIGLLIACFIAPLSRVLQAPALSDVMYLFLPGLLMLIPFSHFEWIQNANADFRGVFWAYLTRQGISFCCIVADLLLTGHVSLTALILYFNIGLFAGMVVSGFFAARFLHRTMQYDRFWIRRLWHYGKFVFGTNISSSLFRNTDQFIISSCISTSAVALYSVCLRISNLIDVPSQVLGDILFPKSARMMESGNMEKVRFYYEKAVGSILAIAVPVSIVIFTFPKLIIGIIAGAGYTEASVLLQITVLYGLFLPFIKQFGTIMDSIGQPRTNFIVMTITAVLNIGICLFFTTRFGVQGTAYGMMVSYGICFIITQTILYRKLQVSIGRVCRYMLLFYPDMLSVFQERFLLKWKTR